MHPKRFAVFTLFLFSSFCFAAGNKDSSGHTDEKKSILYISCGDDKTKDFQKSLSILAESIPDDYTLYYQSMDYNSESSSMNLKKLEGWYPQYLRYNNVSAVLAADKEVYNFVVARQEQYFKNISVIAAFDYWTEKKPSDTAYNVHIIDNSACIEENIKLINSIFPRTRKIIFIGTSPEEESALKFLVSKYEIDGQFKNISGMTKDEIARYASSIDKSSILFLPDSGDMNTNTVNTETALKAITDSTQNPVFTVHDVNFGEGILGGYFVSKKDICLAVAKILKGFISVNEPPQPNYYFDFVQMQRFKILKSFLSTNASFINDNQAQDFQQKKFIFSLSVIIILIVALIIVCVFFNNKANDQNSRIKEEREKLNAVISQSDSLFWECNFGRKEEEIFLDDDPEKISDITGDIAQGWIDSGIIPEEYLEKYNDLIAELKSGADMVSIDLPLLQEDIHTHLTSTRWKHIVYKSIEKKDGKTFKAMATATDITSRKRAEEEYEGEMSYRSFINKEFPAYARLNLTSNVVLERMINIPELNRTLPDSTADNELESFVKAATTEGQNQDLAAALTRKEMLTSFMNGTRSKDWDFYYEFSTGIIKWFKLTAELTSNPHTNCIESNIYMRNITNQKIMSISKDSVLDEEVEYIFWLDMATSQCHFIHQAKNANWLPEEKDETNYYSMIENMLKNVVSSKDHDSVENFFDLKYLTIKLKDKQAANCTFEIITDNLRIAIKQVRSYYLNSNPNIIVFIYRDITDITLFEKLQNEKLTKAIEQAEKANASKSDFLSRMSHDLRTPMNGVIGIAELAEDELDNPTAIHDDLRKIKSSSKYMVGLLNDILDMAKIESGKLEIRKSRNSAGEIIEFICTQAKALCDQHRINFYCNIDPGKYMNFFINVDRLHCQQIIMNLLSNASKFTPEQGRIEFLIKQTNRNNNTISLEVIVSDTGSGMTKEFQKVMFEAFTQDVNSINKQGTGLGLSIVNSLVHLMGGTIACDSAPAEGTIFKINLDIEILEEIKTESPQPVGKKEDKKIIDLTGKKILLVEDNALNQEISRRILQKKGMEVTIAENGLVALNTFSESEPGEFDLVLMDVMMPVMGGIESAHLLRSIERKDAKSIPIVALTANAFQEDIQKCLDAGMNTHLAKPINPVLLIQTISDLLSTTQEPVTA